MADSVQIPDVLADRYASAEMRAIWSPVGKILLEREFWLAVMRAQRSAGLAIPEEAIAAYERVKDRIDLESIRGRERETRHDVKARIDEYCALAGHQQIHKGLTSRDLTENVEQLQLLRSLRLLRVKYAGCLRRLGERVHETAEMPLAARTHNIPAQLTTVGRRLAMFGMEMLLAFERLERLLQSYPVRGLKGPVGTQLDLMTLLGGDRDKVEQLERELCRSLGFEAVLDVPGQVYPRSLDFEVVSVLCQLASGPGSLARTLRLMAGCELASEGFQEGQVGSSAMPHKVNSRSCERINGLGVVLRGFLEMVSGLVGDQWNEGDVSCSVVRRVALPGAMFAIDGLLETFLVVISEARFFRGAIEAEVARQMPFLATTTILMEALKRGRPREVVHEAIKENSLRAAQAMREGGKVGLVELLAADERVGLSVSELTDLLGQRQDFFGGGLAQVGEFLKRVDAVIEAVPESRRVEPGRIL